VLEHVGARLAQGDLDVMGAVLVHADSQQARADTWRATGTERPSRGSDRASSSCTASSSPLSDRRWRARLLPRSVQATNANSWSATIWTRE
jgi:hypothetical protein